MHDVDHRPALHRRYRPAGASLRRRQPAHLPPAPAPTAPDGRFRTPLTGGRGSPARDGLPRPGGGNNVGVALVLVATTSAWAAGSLYARGAPLPSSPLLSASMQMLSAALFLGIAGLAGGEANDVHMSSFTLKPLLAFAYLVLVGSL